MVSYSSPLRNELKTRYGVWAGKEVPLLGSEGKRSGIPTLVRVDPVSYQELDCDAKEKVETLGFDECMRALSS